MEVNLLNIDQNGWSETVLGQEYARQCATCCNRKQIDQDSVNSVSTNQVEYC